MTKEQIARACHEANRAYCASLGDFSQLPWEMAPNWQVESAMRGVELHQTNPFAGPAGSHESWMQEKLASGWVWGEVKDAEKKTHPCLVPFAELPVEQRAKDFIFEAIVRSLSAV